jgi:hypothetical protein
MDSDESWMEGVDAKDDWVGQMFKAENASEPSNCQPLTTGTDARTENIAAGHVLEPQDSEMLTIPSVVSERRSVTGEIDNRRGQLFSCRSERISKVTLASFQVDVEDGAEFAGRYHANGQHTAILPPDAKYPAPDDFDRSDSGKSRAANLHTARTGRVQKQPYRNQKQMFSENLALSAMSGISIDSGSTGTTVTSSSSMQIHDTQLVTAAPETSASEMFTTPIWTPRSKIYGRPNRVVFETPNGSCEVEFTGRTGVIEGSERKGLGARLKKCREAIEKYDPKHTLTGQVYELCGKVLDQLTSPRFLTMTNTVFTDGVKSNLLDMQKALTPRKLDRNNGQLHLPVTKRWLEDCLSAMLSNYDHCENCEQHEPIWPQHVRIGWMTPSNIDTGAAVSS